jgi:subtilisin family serine protease
MGEITVEITRLTKRFLTCVLAVFLVTGLTSLHAGETFANTPATAADDPWDGLPGGPAKRVDSPRQPGRGDDPQELPGVRSLKTDPRVSSAVVDSVEETLKQDPTAPIELIMVYQNVPDEQEIQRILDLGGTIQSTFAGINGLAISLPTDQVLSLMAKTTGQLDQSQKLLQVDWNAPMRFTLDVARQAANLPEGQIDLGRSLVLADGRGVTIALIDSGVRPHLDYETNLLGCVNVIAEQDAATSIALGLEEKYTADLLALSPCLPTEDPLGHGTHIAGILVGSGASSAGRYRGIAPAASLISLRVLDHEGQGDMRSVITALEWVMLHKDDHNIRVVNLSLGGPYFVAAAKDPLVQAVEALWEAGIVVVCSAGNYGPLGNFAITRPGNSPRVITVGSLTDWNTLEYSDDMVSSFSSRGPTTIDHYLKPDLVAPGNRIISTRAR